MSIKEKAFILIITLLCIVFFFNVGFAIEDEDKYVVDNNNNLNLEFANEKIVESYGIINNMANIEVSKNHKDISLNNLDFECPGAFVEFSVDIVNNGKTSAQIETINVTGFENSEIIKFYFLNREDFFNKTLKPKEKCTISFMIKWDEECCTEVTEESLNFSIQIPVFAK